MKNLCCKNCAGTMIINASGMTAVCPYCGTRYTLNHEDTDYYKNFYQQMNRFLSGSESDRERQLKADELWENARQDAFVCTDGRSVDVKWMHKQPFRGGEMLVARKNIVFHFFDGGAFAERFRRTVSFLDYPSADTRKLSQFFPNVIGGFELMDGSCLLVVSKDMDEYPLSLFGQLGGRHVAWIISRMENLCCVLEYNSLVHPKISVDTLFINPYTHQACLYGGWWEAAKNNSLSADGSRVLTTAENLTGLRNTAANLLGYTSSKDVRANEDVPKALADFISSKPMSNAYDDFAYWDDMLIKAYGERKFMNLSTSDGQIYGKE